MKWLRIFACALLFAGLASGALAQDRSAAYEITFSQEVMAMAADGTPYPQVGIEPDRMEGVKTHRFDLGRGRLLQVETNIEDVEGRGLSQLAGVVRRSYDYVEEQTGRMLDKGVLLYLIELDTVPYAYRFEATYPGDTKWSEVRLALLRRGEALTGPYASRSLTELIYDTIPHELGHDVLAGVSTLPHDVDTRPSYQTRWFIEGVCEVLAKGFVRREAPQLMGRFLAMRNVDTVMTDPAVRDQIFGWAQHNGNLLGLESDLYGAAMLLLMAWTETVGLDLVLGEVATCPGEICGSDLVALMEASVGRSREEIVALGQEIGERLGGGSILARQQVVGAGGGG